MFITHCEFIYMLYPMSVGFFQIVVCTWINDFVQWIIPLIFFDYCCIGGSENWETFNPSLSSSNNGRISEVTATTWLTLAIYENVTGSSSYYCYTITKSPLVGSLWDLRLISILDDGRKGLIFTAALICWDVCTS